jgi:glycosyltransferase involved in cell wall biosynthesis
MTGVSVRPADSLERSARNRGWLNVVSHLDAKYGGISAVLPSLCSAVASESDRETAIAGFCGPDENIPNLSDRGVRVERYPLGRAKWMLDREIRERFAAEIRSADGVHIHGIWQEHCLVAASLARSFEKPYIISAHGMLDRWALSNKNVKKVVYSWLFENRNLRGAACLHALTRTEADDYTRAGLRRPMVVIPNGIEVPAQIHRERFIQAFPHLRGKRLILFLGRIHYKKGLDILCRAWQKVSARWPYGHLVLAGPDFENTRTQAERLIADLGSGASVTFTGMLAGDLKWSALAAADVFVLPSYSEGLSVSVLEAMGTGKPVIVSAQCNVPEVQTEGCGWEIQPVESELEAAIEEFRNIAAPRLADMGANGRRVVHERYSWRTIGQRMAEVYAWAGGGRQPDFLEM